MKEENKNQSSQNTGEKHKPEEKKKIIVSKEAPTGRIIRIFQTDVPGNKSIYAGLTRIKGVSWAISNAICIKEGFNKRKKIESLSKEEIQKIENSLKIHNFPVYMLNRRKDILTGENTHLLGNALDLAKELDIKRLKKIRSFRGLRHATGQPTRGQRTRSHFRTNRKRGVGLKNKPIENKGVK